MTHQLMSSYGVGAAGLGTISAFFYYGYTPMQLPAGLLYDRFSPRIILPIATVICALGTLFFAITHSPILASNARFMMGLGSAFSFIGTLVLIARWFPPKYFALLAGITQSMSSVGAIIAGAPLTAVIYYIGWRHSLIGLSIMGFILAIAMWLFIKDSSAGVKKEVKEEKLSHQTFKGLRYLLHNSQSWYIAIYGLAIWAAIITFAALWGVPYIKQFFHTTTTIASMAIAMIWIGIAIGSPFLGWLSDRIKRRCLITSLCASGGVLSTLSILYIPHLSFSIMCVALFGIGIAASGQSLSFAIIKDNTPPAFVGTAVGFNNMAIVSGGALFQPLVGYLLHIYWSGATDGGVPVYGLTAYRHALWVLPVCFIVALIMSWFFIKETHCRPSYNRSDDLDQNSSTSLTGEKYG